MPVVAAAVAQVEPLVAVVAQVEEHAELAAVVAAVLEHLGVAHAEREQKELGL